MLRRLPRSAQRAMGSPDHIECGKSKACQQSELGVRQSEVAFNGLLENRQQLAVDKIEAVNHGEHYQRVVGGFSGGVGVCLFRLLVRVGCRPCVLDRHSGAAPLVLLEFSGVPGGDRCIVGRGDHSVILGQYAYSPPALALGTMRMESPALTIHYRARLAWYFVRRVACRSPIIVLGAYFPAIVRQCIPTTAFAGLL